MVLQVGGFPRGRLLALRAERLVCWSAGFRACGAPYFLLLRQKKVSKEKATLVDAGRCPVPCATRFGRGHPGSTSSRCCASLRALRNSGLRPSDSPRPLSAQTCVAQRLTRGPESVMERPAARFSKRCSGSAAWVCGGFPRQRRVAQGTLRSRALTPGRLFFAHFLLAKQKKVQRASSAKNNGSTHEAPGGHSPLRAKPSPDSTTPADRAPPSRPA